jgi:drug/metabolite transporter (DMT)-like permease
MSNERRATLWLLGICVIWGSSFFAMKLGEQGLASRVGADAAPAAFLFLRFLVAAAIFPFIFPGALRRLTPRVVGAGVLLSLGFYAGFLLQVTGLHFTTPTVSAFLTNLTVVTTPLLGRLVFRERLTWGNLAGATIAIAGVYVLTDPAGGAFRIGEILTAVSAIAWAVQIQLTNVLTRKHPPDSITFVLFCCATVFSGVTLVALGADWGALARAWTAPDVAWSVLFTATACSIGAITIMNRFQRDLPATRAAVIYTLEPVFAAALSAAFIGEPMTLRKIAGGAIIVGGNLVCELFRKDVPEPQGRGAESV